MATTGREHNSGEGDRLPIFTSVGERSSRHVGTAILALLIAAVIAVVIANSVG